mmetsp:Transcript_49216/g.60452  ORF Transcript_49216/g.60452 Transcript_49216/m.60452 type:complete len:242 (+) Transcript_49216:153-878(+)
MNSSLPQGPLKPICEITLGTKSPLRLVQTRLRLLMVAALLAALAAHHVSAGPGKTRQRRPPHMVGDQSAGRKTACSSVGSATRFSRRSSWCSLVGTHACKRQSAPHHPRSAITGGRRHPPVNGTQQLRFSAIGRKAWSAPTHHDHQSSQPSHPRPPVTHSSGATPHRGDLRAVQLHAWPANKGHLAVARPQPSDRSKHPPPMQCHRPRNGPSEPRPVPAGSAAHSPRFPDNAIGYPQDPIH